MTFADLIRILLREHPEGLAPQQIRDMVKADYPDFYGTESHRRNVEKQHYKDLDHALLAQIYVASRTGGQIFVDRTQKPIRLSLVSGENQEVSIPDEEIDSENFEKLELGVGRLYLLGTALYTKDGEEIVKIGITTGTVEGRITQLYTTGVPFRFRVIQEIETKNYYELEQSLHKLLDPFRINKSREFFTDRCIPFFDRVIKIHNEIHDIA